MELGHIIWQLSLSIAEFMSAVCVSVSLLGWQFICWGCEPKAIGLFLEVSLVDMIPVGRLAMVALLGLVGAANGTLVLPVTPYLRHVGA